MSVGNVSASDAAVLWKNGKLRFLLHAGQRELYDHHTSWEAASLQARQRGHKMPGVYPRVYAVSASRRFGKDWYSVVWALGNAIRRPKSVLTYATALGKDITSIVIPLFEQVTASCPPALKPVFKASYQGTEAGIYLHNGSVIKLVGIDRNPNGLRGRFSDGIVISEAAFVDNLKEAVVSVLLPQLQGRLHASILLNSTPSVIPGHAFEENFLPDAQDHGRFFTRTILDNPLLSESEREEFIAAAGGRESETCRREYFCEIIRSESRVVIPEFDFDKHVKATNRPEFAHGYTCLDPGVRDICAVNTAYYDFERAKLVIDNEWGKPGANTNDVAAGIASIEAQSFATLQWWDGTALRPNPFQRYSDTEARLILDLNSLHKIKIAGADKDGAEAALHSMRNAFQRGLIEVHPRCVQTIKHLQNAVWNKSRTSYERSDVYGHWDFIDSVKYLWRHVNKITNPFPPKGFTLAQNYSMDNLYVRPEHLKTKRRASESIAQALPKSSKVRRFK